MMAIGETRRSLDFSQKTKSNKKRTTPFSIDDILSNSKKLKTNSISLTKNDEVLKNKREDFSEKTFLPGLYLNSITEKSEEYYSKWIAEFYKLYSTKLLQPFWFSPLNTEAYHNRFSSQPNFLPLNLNIEPFHTSESNPCHRSPNNSKRLKHHSVRQSSFSPASTNKKEENQSKERSASRDEHSACSSCNRDSVKSTVDFEMIKQDSSTSDSPLSALEKLTCVTFKELEHKQNILHAIAQGREAKMKRRKCRTAFTAFQLSILEQQFNCHKYLTPTDRDQLAQGLGLSASQVITWFQNRRAKQKRDLEELKKDIKTVKTWNDAESENSSSPPRSNDDENIEVDVEK